VGRRNNTPMVQVGFDRGFRSIEDDGRKETNLSWMTRGELLGRLGNLMGASRVWLWALLIGGLE